MSQDSNSTTTPTLLQGWVASPQTRGTFDILSSCLVAIIASTWTILHLNLPGSKDSSTTKFFRKLKWMLFTIMFPEFIFAHAMEERLMAYMALERLSEAGVETVPLGHKKFAVAALIGNLEWRELPSVLAQFWPFLRSVPSPREESANDTASWMNRLTRFHNHTELASCSSPPHKCERAESSPDLVAEAGTLVGQDSSVAAEARRSPVEVQGTSQENKSNNAPWKQTHEWTIAHAIFANMGGFRLAAETKNGTIQYRTISGFQLASLLKTGALSQIPNFSKEQILDKSKTDAFARWLAILQCLWLLLELLARKAESLPSTQIEIATMAFACCSVLTYIAVQHKPKDVDVALDVPSTISQIENIPSISDPLFQRPVSFFLEIFCYNYWQPKGYNSLMPGPGRLLHPNRMRLRRQDPGETPGQRVLNDSYLVRNYRSHPMAGWLLIGSTVFGGVHCAAWNFYFASSLERRLWRAAALVTTLAPLLLPIIDRGANTFQRRFNLNPRSTRGRLFMNFWTAVPPLTVLLAYVSLRICIIVLVFSSLRALPEGVYHTTWTQYFLSVH